MTVLNRVEVVEQLRQEVLRRPDPVPLLILIDMLEPEIPACEHGISRHRYCPQCSL